jgi:hypothetical protein
MVLAEAPNPRGGAWLLDDRIVFSPEYTSGLSAVPARGGKVEILTKPDAARGERTHRWPAALPGEKALLFTVGSVKSPSNYDQAEIHVLDLATGKTRKVLEGGSMARYVPEGRLAFLRNNTLLVAPFDPKRVALTGDAAPVLEKVGGDTSGGSAYAAFAADGTLAFVLGAWAPANRRTCRCRRVSSRRRASRPTATVSPSRSDRAGGRTTTFSSTTSRRTS